MAALLSPLNSCLLGVVPQPTDSRLSETTYQPSTGPHFKNPPTKMASNSVDDDLDFNPFYTVLQVSQVRLLLIYHHLVKHSECFLYVFNFIVYRVVK